MADALPNDETNGAEFVRLLTAHQPDIYLYLRSLVLDPEEASEVLQDANLVLWEKRSEFQLGTNFRAWAFQIARYKLLQHQGQRKRACRCFSDALVDELMLQASEGETALGEMIEDLRRCIAMLSPRDRELIGRRYAPRETCQSVARSVGRPVRWVYKALGRIRQTLLECVMREAAARRSK
ncbi:MAG: sigma-70 family RNA polymerase sigma factor [Pirellulales bacterium]|nr:sigma-70 family RNA polymerase sigma factor [Pirellulales bacterium]